ncbi:MAG: cache domain-containing protein [Rhizobiales bacterium]|nr:hypothetical protein [Hyphomicrobiales bacterium]NRB14420.1 cache domain-containing protein [Hyphomicrobiales bacterium]
MIPKTLRKLLLATSFVAVMSTSAMAAGAHVAPLEAYAQDTVAQWIANSVIIDAIKAQNIANADLTEAQIIDLDNVWRAETDASSRPMIDEILANAVSALLANYKDASMGMVTEIFIMDNKGMNVGQSDVTSDYWQGDEGKWQKTYLVGPEAVFVDEVEMDESSQTLQSQLSMSIVDPASGEVIGAITVGVNVDEL